jgi:prevent-host-death family protein
MSEEAIDDIEPLSVAEAKARFSELADRVARGERFVVTRRGVPALGLVPPDEVGARPSEKLGLAALAGALADWDDLDDVVAEIYRARGRASDRPAPDLG